MNANDVEDTAAVMNAFDTAIQNYNRVVELVEEMRAAPSLLAESGDVCLDCLLRLTLRTAMLLRKISDTGYEGYEESLEYCAMIISPELVCEAVPPSPSRNDLH